MIAYANIANEETKQVNIVAGKMVKLLGAVEMEVEQAYNGAWYVKGYAPAKPEPTLEEQVYALESQYQMTRWQREGILAEGSLYSDYTKAKAQEIEDLAAELRTAEKASEVEEVVISKTENTTNVEDGWNG